MTVKSVLIGIGTLVVLAVGAGIFILWRLDVRGRAAVDEMCALDGGPTVYETAFAPGFLTESYTSDQCAICAEGVGERQFEFVDHEAKNKGMFIDEPGYYRWSLSTLGDPRCEAYLRAKERFPYLRIPQDYGREADRCFAIEHLPTRPDGYVYSESFRRAPAPNGRVLGVVEQFVRHEPTGRVLAVNRDYLYTAGTSTFLAGPGGITDATCPAAYEWRFNSRAMLTAVLRDEDRR
jgi:hypothetical protein